MTKSLLQRNVQPQNTRDESTPAEHTSIPSAGGNAVMEEKTLPALEEKEQYSSARRAGDSGLGRPVPVKKVAIPDDFSSAEEENIIKNEIENDDPVATSIYAPAWICKTLRACLLFIVAVAVFFIVTQTASFLANVRQLSLLEQILLSIPLAIFGGIIIGIIVKILFLLRKLKVSPQIKIKALQELEERKSLRKICLKNNRESVEQLCSFLKNSFVCNETVMAALGFTTETIESIKKHRERLIQEAETPTGTSQGWIADFRKWIQDPLDQVAKKRILRYSMNTAIMTGISPFSLIDRLIVLSACLSMLKDLLQIYSLKPSWDKNLVLMGQVIVNTYLAGVIENITETGIDVLHDNLQNIATEKISKIPNCVWGGIGKTAEATAQGYMVYRLGKAAIRVLHPVSIPRDETHIASLYE